VLGNVSNAYFPDVLEQLGVAQEDIRSFSEKLESDGRVLIPQISLIIEGEERIFSLLSTRTTDSNFSYLNGVQGQFVDRTTEFELRRERERLLEDKLRDSEIIAKKPFSWKASPIGWPNISHRRFTIPSLQIRPRQRTASRAKI
jgi:hypothetical protein